MPFECQYVLGIVLNAIITPVKWGTGDLAPTWYPQSASSKKPSLNP